MKPALATYGAALRQAATGEATPLDLLAPGGLSVARMDAAHWYGDRRPGDEALLDVCCGATLDVGCGPGRLVIALSGRGVPALGIDISNEAVTQAQHRGATVKLCDVFAEVPDEGWWAHVLLADGNIGIGGDPAALLRRCTALLRPRGTLVVELGAPGSGTWRRPVRMRHNGKDSAPFWWAAVASEDLGQIAEASALEILGQWTVAGRWFARLSPRD